MLVKFKTTWLDQDVYVNPQYVVSMRQASHTERMPMPRSGSTLFFIAGQVDIDFPATYGEDNRELHTARVFGTLDEVAAKINGVSSKHFEKALAMAIEFDQRRNTEAPCKS